MRHPIVIGSDGITSTKSISLMADLPPLPPEYQFACITWKTEYLELPPYRQRKRFHRQ